MALQLSQLRLGACAAVRSIQQARASPVFRSAAARFMSAPATPASLGAESFLSGTGAVYAEEMYRAWKADPASVHKSWDVYFRNVDAGLPPGAAFTPLPSVQSVFTPVAAGGAGPSSAADVERGVRERLAITHLIRAFQVSGHQVAPLDPLNINNRPLTSVPEISPAAYGFTDADLDRSFSLRGIEGLSGFLGPSVFEKGTVTLRELLRHLHATYVGPVGWEYMHVASRDKRNWIRDRIEHTHVPAPPKAKRMATYQTLAVADMFERYLAKKFNTAKRFGLEGCEALIPGMQALVDRSAELGVTGVVLGMPHRGRLNMLVNVVRKPMEELLSEFQGTSVDVASYNKHLQEGDWNASGDVKYHQGASYDYTHPATGAKVHMTLLANPSHLECVNTVVLGKVRAKQDNAPPGEQHKTLGVIMHGDAAFAGQGVVYETFLLSRLNAYETGGSIHVVVNNQVGFTTDPSSSRSTLHCTDIGRAFDVPIFHVNADDPEAVVRVFEMAAEYRMAFKSDVIVEIVGYRKHGHNELDQPMFTQPVLYTAIAKHKSALELFTARLIAESAASDAELAAVRAGVSAGFDAAWDRNAKAHAEHVKHQASWLHGQWEGLKAPHEWSRQKNTGVPLATLQRVANALVALPPGFKLHSSLAKIQEAKAKTLEAGRGIDWGTAEGLAFGSLLLEGHRVRLSGQDVERGTFSHRHAVLHHQLDNSTYTPLAHLGPGAGPFTACNSPLSEFGVMGFDLGYSLDNPNQLVIWEAQFGDFVNGAQVMIDQFIASGEAKWYRQTGLTLLLPHGLEGQGPEHSSCRLERFLQSMDDQESVVPPMEEKVRVQIQHANMQVVNVSTPANFFHVLRRQVHRDFRKPLIVATPKSLLRHRLAVSTLEDMAEGTRFQRYIPERDARVKPEAVRKLVLCSGKVYYELVQHRDAAAAWDVAIDRVEQIAPFPFDHVSKQLAKYPKAEVVWAQEEPRNMGAWAYVAPRIATAARVLGPREVTPSYAGRPAAASPATGSSKIHDQECERLLKDTFA